MPRFIHAAANFGLTSTALRRRASASGRASLPPLPRRRLPRLFSACSYVGWRLSARR